MRVPYGSFEYLGAMPGVLPGGVPWAVPFAWVPLMLSAFALAQRVTSSVWVRWLVSVVVLVVMDFVLDPGAVALGIWRYAAPGWWYEVPWTNFIGWCLTGGLVFIPMSRIRLVLPGWMRAGTWMLLAFWTGVALINGFWGVVLVAMGLCVLEVRLAMEDSSRQ